jgi:branched-chain amino acid transport system ATP-binding protein
MLLEVRDLAVRYGSIEAVRGLSFSVEEGSIVAVIGANGAGKSSSLLALSGLVRSSGSIRFAGREIGGQRADRIVRAGLVQVPEGRAILSPLSVAENLELGAWTRSGEGVAEDLARVYELFPRLSERSRQLAGSLSGGEQQMLAIGRALMASPRLLLLDEPSMGLAPKLVSAIFAILAEIRKRGTTILLVEQNALMALKLAHRAYVLQTGRIVLSGPAAEVARDENVKKAYLGI